jgi:glycosyltransferase involved in cell wall biosynthesis
MVNPGASQEVEKIRSLNRDFKASLHLKNAPRVILITHCLSNGQIAALHNQGHCFISLHHAEGFGMPIAEAMLFGKPVITTGYGGPQDFVEHRNTGLLVDYVETPVSGMPWDTYTGDQLWAEPFIMDARQCMRQVYANHWPNMGAAAKQSILTHLSYDKIGQQMAQYLL